TAEGQASRTLTALDRLPPGAVIFVLMPQEPTFLYPELLARGHQWAGNFDDARTAFRFRGFDIWLNARRRRRG
ncbi:DUF2249 domain-containing protein, partial [Xylella fastidiosa subsp. multiplex]|nr:DUF2249 domain-containing protein [Xylella fastidiosa subsp. multiplex]